MDSVRCVTQFRLDSLFSICSFDQMELSFKVVEVVLTFDRIIATADNLTVAFDTAVSLWPGTAIELRQKARVIVSSEAK